MKFTRLKTTFIIIVFFKICNAQNLVPNPGFETIITCPTGAGQLFLALPWDSLNTSPDLFNTCYSNPSICSSVDVPVNFSGYASSHSGNGYAGIEAKGNLSNYREYIQAPLNAPLVSGEIYKIEAWFRRASNSSYSVSTLGITLSVGQLTQSGTTNFGFTPLVESSTVISDTSNWTLVQGFIIAAGGENYITIGNFRDDASSGIVMNTNPASTCAQNNAYYYIDDVSVQLVNEQLNISGDTLICPGTGTTLFANTNTVSWWSISANPSISISNNSTISVNPIETTTYLLHGIYKQDSITISVIQPPIVNLRADTIICEREFVLLDASNANSIYEWSTGETTPTINANQNVLYWVNVDNGGCIVSDTFNLTVLTNPSINLGTDTVYCSFTNNFITLDAGIGTGYLWEPTNEVTRTILVRSPNTYKVTVNYLNGCSKDTSIIIKEVCEPKFYVPTSFTPDDNGLNDMLCPLGNSFETVEFTIFNRWGDIVFVSDNPSSCWDGNIKGKKASTGVYAYMINYTAVNEYGLLQKGRKTGTVTIIR